MNYVCNSEDLEVINDSVKCSPRYGAKYLERIEGWAGELHMLCEDECNYGQTDDSQRVKEDLINKIEGLVSSVWGDEVKVYFNGDPRGNPVGLILPDGRSNNMGGIDWRLDATRFDR